MRTRFEIKDTWIENDFDLFFWGGGGEEVRWKTVRTYGKILATPLIGCFVYKELFFSASSFVGTKQRGFSQSGYTFFSIILFYFLFSSEWETKRWYGDKTAHPHQEPNTVQQNTKRQLSLNVVTERYNRSFPNRDFVFEAG